MADTKSYLDDLPGVSAWSRGKFRLDDLDFADDPLKRKIDFIDDALLAPPKPSADITSGIRTSREVMGGRKAQPTDAVGMRPEDYVRRPQPHGEHAKEPQRSAVRTPEPARQPERKPAEPAVGVRQSRPANPELEAAYERYKARKREAEEAEQRRNPAAREAAGKLEAAKAALQQRGAAPQQRDAVQQMREAAQRQMAAAQRAAAQQTAARGTGVRSGRGGTAKTGKLLALGIVIAAIFIQVIGGLISQISSEPSIDDEPAGGLPPAPILIEDGDVLEDQWFTVRGEFSVLLENTVPAGHMVGTTVYDWKITDEMLDYLIEEAHSITEKDECTIYETDIVDDDIDLYDYGDYAWIRFWQNNYEDVVDIAFTWDDMIIRVIDVNDDRVAEYND